MSKHDRGVDQPDDRPESSELPDASATAEAAETEPVRRALIRATFKPGEGPPPSPRQPPVFTMHEQSRATPGANRGSRRVPNGNVQQRDNGHPNKKKTKSRSSRSGQQGDRNGQPRSGRPSRRGKSRPR